MNSDKMNSKDRDTSKSSRWGAIKKILCGAAVFVLILALCPAMFAQAAEQTVDVTEALVETNPELFVPKSMPIEGEAKIAVFLIDFPDFINENPLADTNYYEGVYFNGCPQSSWGNEMSVAEFYEKESFGKLTLSGRVFDWYTAKNDRSYYNGKKEELITEAAEYYMEQGVDFSEFDGNGDGVIDAISFHFAGDTSNDSSNSWYSGLAYSGLSGKIGDMTFTNLIQVGEEARVDDCGMVSIVCHELMHLLGMPDLYGTSMLGFNPVRDLMSSNAYYVNPYTKILLGWVETVRVITGDVENIRVDTYGDSGDFVIVTDEFNGFFDEFYIVSYGDDPVVLHIDARLNDEGTSFLYQNLNYDPRPDENAAVSKYLFMEEISADPDFDYVLNNEFLTPERIFGENSVLGPNSVPSSDTHDGEYTGIRMENFVELDGYMTFDVSFVNDTEAPTVTTDHDDLALTENFYISFSEFIYEGETWEGVSVTDLEGNALDATVIIPSYPHHQIEITFNDDSYNNGYILTFPEGSVNDSSGNSMSARTYTVSPDDFMLPTGETQLPSPGYASNGRQYIRNNAWAYWFYHDNDFVVITILGYSGDGYDSAVEIMRLDYDGTVLEQYVTENPFKGSYISDVAEMGNGSYVFFCHPDEREGVDLMFGVDSEGNVKWTNDDYLNTTAYFYGFKAFKRGDGLVFSMITYVTGSFEHYEVYVDPETGATTKIDMGSFHQFFNLSGNRLLRVRNTFKNGAMQSYWEILDGDTYEVLASSMFEGNDLSNDYTIIDFHENSDGTFLITASVGNDHKVFLLDAEMNLVKSVVVGKDRGDVVNWIADDGFVYIKLIQTVDHDDSYYRVYRYDRNLNLMWKEDVICNFIRYFKSPSGELLAYKSMFSPIRECYIVTYESEDSRKTEHEHALEYAEDREPTCVKQGFLAHWYCDGCGVKYSDAAGEIPITNIAPYITPAMGHTEEIIPAVSANCISEGHSQGTKCSVCDEILVAPTVWKKWPDHPYDKWVTVKNATCKEEGLRVRNCVGGCGTQETEAIPIDENAHSFGAYSMITQATCNSEGLSGRSCADCGRVETTVIPVDDKNHSFGSYVIVKEATCAEEGKMVKTCERCSKEESITISVSTKTHTYSADWVVSIEATCGEKGEKTKTCDCGAEVDRDVILATGDHSYGDWNVIWEPTCVWSGLETRSCNGCDDTESRSITLAEGEHTFGEWTTVKKATCGTEGSESRQCDCGLNTETRTTKVSDEHILGKWETTREPNCGEEGEQTRQCPCGKEIETRTIGFKDLHILGTWETVRKPTCGQDGKEIRQCPCGKRVETLVIPSDGEHVYGEWVITNEATTEAEGEEMRVCQRCTNVEIRSIEKLEATDRPEEQQNKLRLVLGVVGVIVVVLGIVGVTGVAAIIGGVSIFRVVLKKKKRL